MLELLKGLKKGVVLYSIIAVLMGIILIIYPTVTSQVICYGIAGIIFICGLMDFTRYFSQDFHEQSVYDLITGFILCSVGTFMILRSDVVIMMIPFIIGVFIVIEGIMNIMRTMQLKRRGFQNWIYDLGLSILLLILGIVLIVDPFEMAMWSITFIGICLIYDGLLNLLVLHRSHQLAKEFKKYMNT